MCSRTKLVNQLTDNETFCREGYVRPLCTQIAKNASVANK